MLDIFADFEKRNNKSGFESELNDFLSWLWENLDDTKINNEILGCRDDFNHFLESENINTDDIIENIEKGKNAIVKQNDWFIKTAAENYINELLEKAFFAGVEAAENEINQRINDINDNIDRIKKEVEEFTTPANNPNASDLMKNLYKKHKEMNLFIA